MISIISHKMWKSVVHVQRENDDKTSLWELSIWHLLANTIKQVWGLLWFKKNVMSNLSTGEVFACNYKTNNRM